MRSPQLFWHGRSRQWFLGLAGVLSAQSAWAQVAEQADKTAAPLKQTASLPGLGQIVISLALVVAAIVLLAFLYKKQGRYLESELLFLKTIEIIKNTLGDYHPNNISSLNNLAELYREMGLNENSSIYFEIGKFESKYHNDMSLSIEFCLYRLRARMKKRLMNRN